MWTSLFCVHFSNTENVMESSRLKREHKSDEPLEKLTLDPKRFDSREARTKESWMKQPYPVRRSDSIHYDDNIPASSESVRAPRVHFVTQRRLESGMPRSYEREARAKNFDRNDYFRDTSREMDYYQPRYSRHYDPMPNHYRYQKKHQFNNTFTHILSDMIPIIKWMFQRTDTTTPATTTTTTGSVRSTRNAKG